MFRFTIQSKEILFKLQGMLISKKPIPFKRKWTFAFRLLRLAYSRPSA